MKALQMLRFPMETLWQYITHPIRSFRNTAIVGAAFSRTVFVGWRAVSVLASHRQFCSFQQSRPAWRDKTRGRYIWRVARRYWAGWILERAGVRLEVGGYTGVDWTQSHVIVINHQSTIDMIACVHLIPNGRFVAKREVLAYPVVGRAARDGAQIVIDRGDHIQSMGAIRTALRTWPDANLIFFAEGSRTRSGALGTFKLGAFAIAREIGLPIVPVAISGAYDALPKGSLLRLVRRPTIRVEFGRAIPAHIVAETNVPALAAIARERIESMLGKHKKPA